MKKTIISTIVRKAVETVCKALDMAIVAVRKAERKNIMIVCKALDMPIVAVRRAGVIDGQ